MNEQAIEIDEGDEEQLAEFTEEGDIYCRRWYVRFCGQAGAIGPFTFSEMVSAKAASERAEVAFGEWPGEVWPTGKTGDGEPYTYTVLDYASNRE